ncbi:TetR/AcrR family transcriptional regulator [Pseudomarimonas arenosa]|uniref:TetR/AcrR family transcriptional regulator n=1 Tax=Pseudomarimonas arenosa TaxID=2774145 RepID=A0AAW3ZIW8_9GAMM|nr:TetR/AcrR family transcriptional regulator [Pseudomarimonas arenosa]MBD8525380.1 TetR/AcrR family transcriptional regulator [Pseudomarimonas arenosa]
MSRPPHAKRRVLEAARQLVEEAGVRSLTFSQLEQRSGVTRGGILHHWPDRKALIHGLIEHDLLRVTQRCRELAAPGDPLSGQVRCALDTKDGVGVLAANLLPEARQYPSTWELVTQFSASRFEDWEWNNTDLQRLVLLLAAEGAFWRRLHGLLPDAPDLDRRLGQAIESQLARLPPESITQPRSTLFNHWKLART